MHPIKNHIKFQANKNLYEIKKMQRNNPSYRRNNTAHPRGASNRRNNKPRTPFCKVCHDAGKSKSEYSSHYVKDRPGPQGKVCCPYLLSLVCRYCHKSGHTPNHCPEVKQKESRRSSSRPTQVTESKDGWSTVPKSSRSHFRVQKTREVTASRRVVNKFDALSFEPSQDEKDERKEFPKLSAAKRSSSQSDDEDFYGNETSASTLSGWSNVAKSAPPAKKEEVKKVLAPATRTSVYAPIKSGRSWADMCDDESDDETEEGSDYVPVISSYSRGTVDNSAWSSASEDEEQYEQDHYGGRGMPYYQDSDSDL